MASHERKGAALFPSVESALSRACQGPGHGSPALAVKLLRSDSLLQTTASTAIVTAAVANRCVYYATGTHRSSSSSASFANVCAIFLDPVSAFHCIIATANNVNYYVSFDSPSAAELVRLRGHQIECVEWPEAAITGDGALTQNSTGDVVVGTRAGIFFLLKVASGREVNFRQLMEFPPSSPHQSAITALRIFRPRSGPSHSLCCLIQQAHLLFGFTGGPNVEHLFAMAGSGAVVKRDHLLFETPRVARPALEGFTLHVRSLLVQPHNCSEVALYSDRRVYELHFNNEQDQVWRQLVTRKRFSEALKVAPRPEDRSLVVAAEGEELFQSGDYTAAADRFADAGTAAVSFEEVCLAFTSKGQHGALLNYVTSLIRSLLSAGGRKTGVQVPVMFLWAGQIYSLLLSKAFAEDPRDDRDQAARLQRDLIDLVRLCRPHIDKACIQALYKLLESNGLFDSTVLVAECLGDVRKAVETMVSRGQTERALEQLYRYDATKERDDLIYEFGPILFRLHSPAAGGISDGCPELGRGGGWQTVDPRRLLPAFRGALSAGEHSEARRASATEYLTHCCCSAGGNRLSRTMQLVAGEPSSWTGLMDLLTQLKAMEPDETGEEQELCRYIRTQGEMPHFDVTFALRICYSMGKTRALTVAYGLVGQYKLAVDVALEHDDLDLAIHNARRCRLSNSGKRKIWLSILNYEAKEGRHGCPPEVLPRIRWRKIPLLERCATRASQVLTIADVLNSIPVNSSNGATLGMFRSEIEKSLDQYETDIHLLNMELEQHKKTMDAVERDFGGGPSDGSNVEGGLGRCVILSQTQRCDLCRQIIYSRGFYAFLCGHAMHKDCLEEAIAMTKPQQRWSGHARGPSSGLLHLRPESDGFVVYAVYRS
ncbi:Vacuolar protein sorting-associated protein 18 like protein [Perkinsus olseni]|uniref:Vacuolar protein sorting-associated protein 18 like protein n=1 Tax=Perkinsus olseni TaxID=32597 RepID=A0A7J6PGQ9_PEROL|nr:Vacuolar protein sorting-associated protein 18 like protein [Perkinsus olseni]